MYKQKRGGGDQTQVQGCDWESEAFEGQAGDKK
jgi:hypothetical protein